MSLSQRPPLELPRWLYLGLLFFFVCALAWHENPADRDLWHRLALGEYIIQHHSLPAHDVFSYLSNNAPLHDHEWGCGLLFYSLFHYAGSWSLVALKYLVYAATVALIDRSARLYEPRYRTTALLYMGLVAFALAPSFISTIRCLVFTNFFLALWIYWLERERAGHKLSSTPFLLTSILWSNLHGGGVSGIGLIALYTLGSILNHRPWRHYVRLGLVVIAGTLCNPYGLGLWTSTVKALLAPRPDFYEWAATPLWNGSYPGFKIMALLGLLLGAGLLIKRGVLWDWVIILAVGVSFILAVKHLRHIALFTIIAGSFLYRGWMEWSTPNRFTIPPWMQRYGSALWIAIAVSLAWILLVTGAGPRLQIEEPHYPVRAITYLKEQALQSSQRLLVPFDWGSYALWELYPHYLVSMDGRYELVYSEATYRAVTDFYNDRVRSDRILHQWPPDWILLPRNFNSPALSTRLVQNHHYRLVYLDETALVFTR